MGKLILVPTPLGNLGDITIRAMEVLRGAEIVLAEDTRTSGKLLKLLDIQAPLRAFHMHNEHSLLERTVADIQQRVGMTALVSDAGTPGISDPGFLLVRACIAAGIVVEALPGPTALIPALVASGIPCDRFVFEGFIPQKKGRQSRMKEWKNEMRTVVFYESPHRIARCLRELEEHVGPERSICVVREISKVFETYHRGSVSELAAHFASHEAKGEIVVVLGAAGN
ncbi:16S rRNA (cytidine(1402)-2'-O)-methyltransferase [Schleiferiaceae bacterium]|jgi:16S rRNA (cytidine1402-2'-O)-methyltransferase|nr:16S rRNA (cytidine(1402)-2'-O)-methyltransferase [Schleiferiaceae bacterium]